MRFFIPFIFLVSLFLTSCQWFSSPDVDTPQVNSPLLTVESSVISLKIGETRSLALQALNEDSETEAVTVTKTGSFSTHTLADTFLSLSLTGSQLGQDIYTLTAASGLTKTLVVNVYDSAIFEDESGLQLAFSDQFTLRWNDGGSGASKNGAYYDPIIPSTLTGFYSVGSLGRSNYTNPNGIDFAILVKDKDNTGLLAAPTDYVLIWTDSGSGANMDGSIWKPVAPEGYVALGLVAQTGYSEPSLDRIRCVRADLTVKGKLGTLIWDDSGSGANADFGSWRIDEPDNLASADGKAFLLTNTLVGINSHSSNNVDMNIANLLYITLPIFEEADSRTAEPVLTGFQPYEHTNPRFTKSLRVPFPLVKDDGRTVNWKVTNAPMYLVQRVEEYSSLDSFDNRQGSNDVTKTISFETGFSQTDTDTFSQEYGIEVSAEGSAGLLGSGGKWSVKLTTTLKWESSVATTFSQTVTRETEYIIPKGKFGELLQVTGKFILLANDIKVGELPMKSSGLKILEYPRN